MNISPPRAPSDLVVHLDSSVNLEQLLSSPPVYFRVSRVNDGLLLSSALCYLAIRVRIQGGVNENG